MAAVSAVKKQIQQTAGGLGTARSAPIRVRSFLSGQERMLLGGAFAFAFLALAISVIARTAPVWPDSVPVLGIGLFIFFLGSGAGFSGLMAWRARPAQQTQGSSSSIHLAAMFDTSLFGIAIWDRHNHLLRANDKYTETLELASVDLILGAPREMIKAIGGRPLAGILDTGREVIRNGQGAFQIIRRKAANGDTIEMVLDVTKLQDNEAMLIGHEERLHHLLKELALLRAESEESVKEIRHLEENLAAERDRAEAASRAKSEFLSNMGHEFRTPLNAILGFADMMRARIFGPMGHEKYAEYADDIYASGEQLLNLVADILDVSQIQSGDVPIDRQRIDLEKTITDCLTMIRPRIYASGIALIEHIDHLPSVYADPMAVRQILMHILSNAMKFTPTGGRISIKSEIDLNQVTLIIDDTGIGIARDIMARLDRPFSMIDQNALITGDEGAGLGVGLSVSRSLARLNGGSLTIESELGYGTTVRITLPRR